MTASGSGGAWSEMTWVGDTSSDPLWVDGGVFVARLIATHWLVGAALVFGVALVLRMLHLRLNASTRHAVWWSVLYLLAVLPLVGVGFSWLATDAEISAGPRDSVWSALVGDRQAAVVPTDPATAADGKAGARSISASGATGSASAHSRALAAMRLALAAVGLALAVFWGLLAAVRFSRLAAAGVAARALRAASRPAPARVRLLARELAASVSGAVCDIRTSNAVAGPACLGVRRPWIAVPDGWSAELSDEAVRHALLHEMGHAARRDVAWSVLEALAGACLALHPAAPIIRRHLADARESACDDWAVEHGAIDPVAYADSLLQSAAALLGATPLRNPLVASFSSASSPLELRVTTMIDPRRDHTARLRVLPLLGFTACLGLATVASALAWPSPGDVGAEIRIADAGPVDGRIVDGSFGTPADASRLFHAISSGDVEAVRAAVDRGASVDQTWFGDGSPLIVAARQGDLEIVEFLVQSGADLDRAVSGDGTALVQAVRHDHREVVESLLRAGADIDADGAPGDGTALIEAAHRSDLTMLELLLAWGADPNLAVMGDDTPLIAAVQRGSLQTVQRLLDAGADPNGEGDVDLRVDGRRTPLNQARLQGLDEIERLLRATGARE